MPCWNPLWVWTAFSVPSILSSCLGQLFHLYETLGISDSQADTVSSKLPRETVRESLSLKAVLQAKLDQTRRVSQKVAETAIVYASPVWRMTVIINHLFYPCFDTSTTYTISYRGTIWPRAALDLCQDLKLHSRGSVGRFRPTSSAPRLPGAPLTVQSHGICWLIPSLSVEALIQAEAPLQQLRKFSLRPPWDTGLLPGPPLKLEAFCSYQICQKCQWRGGRSYKIVISQPLFPCAEIPRCVASLSWYFPQFVPEGWGCFLPACVSSFNPI